MMIKNVEDLYIAENRLEELRAGRTHAIPLVDIIAEFAE
jgi:predicted DNA-binding protein